MSPGHIAYYAPSASELKLSFNLIAKHDHASESLAHTEDTGFIQGTELHLQMIYTDALNGYY